MDCHTRPSWAFVSYPIARVITPIAGSIDKARTDLWLWYIHFLACFIGLAYLPFSKFFHIISSPVSLLVNGVSDQSLTDPANNVTRRAMALDACVHCGACTLRCSVAPVFSAMVNMNILPSEKLIAIKKTLSKIKQFSPEVLQAVQEGSFICTGCYRCTEVCPVGINLQDLWLASKEDLAREGFPELNMWARKSLQTEYAAKIKDHETPLTLDGASTRKHLDLSSRAETFSVCFECQTCTNVCPVVANYENPGEALDLTPHQIMHSLGLGLRDMALGSRMIWDCTTCYLCQEHCPQGVQVTDVFYELKNLAYGQLRTVKHQGSRGQDTEQASAGKTEEITS
jgi:heterodisulfide reductase subunit C